MASMAPETDSEDEMISPNWEQKISNDGFVFYVNHADQTTQWSHPKTGKLKRVAAELPHGWERRTEEGTGRTLFYNVESQSSTYIDPRIAFAVEEIPSSVAELRQRFDGSSTALQVLHSRDLNGKTALITGANAGIGFETARSLALFGCSIIFACRNVAAAAEAVARLEQERPGLNFKCKIVQVDLGSLRSVRTFCEEVRRQVSHIDYLVLNAAVFGLPYTQTEDGLEATFQVCHLSHFLIATSLSELFDHNSRVVVVSSESHRFSSMPPALTVETLSPPEGRYSAMTAYNNAKLCNVLFARELARRWQSRGICVFSLHPGNMVSTSLTRNWWLMRVLFALVRPFTKSLQQAAATTVYCATAIDLTGVTGLYFNNCFVCEPGELGQNDQMAAELWKISEELIKEKLKGYQ